MNIFKNVSFVVILFFSWPFSDIRGLALVNTKWWQCQEKVWDDKHIEILLYITDIHIVNKCMYTLECGTYDDIQFNIIR